MKKILLLSLLITQSSFAEIMCDAGVSKYFAVYEINTYTCAVGEYLPANTLGCVSCPNGFSCPGGTFDFNPDEFQGAVMNTITTTTMNNVCGSNFPKKMIAVYEPNTITINWDDGTNTTTNTCTYGGAIVLPSTPTRPGYIFNGWQVKNN